MDTTNTVVWIVVAVVVVVIVALAVWALANRRAEHRRGEAANIRDQAREESFEVGQREALAEETEAKARAAAAEADAKAAEADRLQQRAGAHSSEAAASREELDKKWQRADEIDPDHKSPDPESGNASHGSEAPRGTETRGLGTDSRSDPDERP